MGLWNWLFGKRKSRPEAFGNEFEDILKMLDSGPQRQDVYTFQHRVIPRAAFDNDPVLMNELTALVRGTLLLHCWSLTEIICLRDGLMTDEAFSDPDAEQARYSAACPTSLDVRRSNGFTAYIYTMPTPVVSPECHYVAILHKDDEPHEHGQPSPSTQYLTLEKSVLPGTTAFCGWTPDGTHLNYGSGPAPDLESFARIVFGRVAPAA